MPRSRHKNKKKERPNPAKKEIQQANYESFVNGYYAGAEAGINQAILLSMYALNKQFGFGSVRLERFYDTINKLALDINADMFSFDDLQAELDGICAFEKPTLTKVG